jgi:hypothetical protein
LIKALASGEISVEHRRLAINPTTAFKRMSRNGVELSLTELITFLVNNRIVLT